MSARHWLGLWVGSLLSLTGVTFVADWIGVAPLDPTPRAGLLLVAGGVGGAALIALIVALVGSGRDRRVWGAGLLTLLGAGCWIGGAGAVGAGPVAAESLLWPFSLTELGLALALGGGLVVLHTPVGSLLPPHGRRGAVLALLVAGEYVAARLGGETGPWVLSWASPGGTGSRCISSC